jgi:hypothetical protein
MSKSTRLKRCPDCGNVAGYTTIEVGPYVVWVACLVCHRTGPEVFMCNLTEMREARREALELWNGANQ